MAFFSQLEISVVHRYTKQMSRRINESRYVGDLGLFGELEARLQLSMVREVGRLISKCAMHLVI
jgi:hypothetical protein